MIRMEGVTKRYGECSVLENFNLEVKAGEAVSIMGESGRGKTTLLRILAGLEQDYHGRVFLAGRQADGDLPYKRNLAMTFQEPSLWNHMTVEGNIMFSLGRRCGKAGALVEHVCRELDIADLLKRYPGEISGGQAKRVSLARALVSGREILLLDEPLSNVDEGRKEKILDFMRREYAGKKTIVYVSHDRDETAGLCSRSVAL